METLTNGMSLFLPSIPTNMEDSAAMLPMKSRNWCSPIVFFIQIEQHRETMGPYFRSACDRVLRRPVRNTNEEEIG